MSREEDIKNFNPKEWFLKEVGDIETTIDWSHRFLYHKKEDQKNICSRSKPDPLRDEFVWRRKPKI